MRSVDIVKVVAQMHEGGLVSGGVMDAMLQGLIFKTTKGTGEYADGMLLTPSGKVSFSLSGLSLVTVADGSVKAAAAPLPQAASASFGSSASAPPPPPAATPE